MWKLAVLPLVLFGACSFGQDLTYNAKLIDPKIYFSNVVQETFYELEEFGFCNFKMIDFAQNISLQLYGWQVSGEVKYTNGFVVSIEKVDLTDITDQFSHSTVNGTLISQGVVAGKINLRDVRVGYDVIANLTNEGVSRYTGVYTHTIIVVRFGIHKNMHTKETLITSSVEQISGGSGVRMVYKPENHISEAISREFQADSTFNSVVKWNRDIITPIMEKIVARTEFPDVCFHC